MTGELYQVLANGVASGAVIALAAVGFSLLYRAVKFFDLSYAASLSVAAYAAYVAGRKCELSQPVSVVTAVLTSSVFASLVYMCVFRQLRQRGALALPSLLASLGVLTITANLLALVFGDAPLMATPLPSSTFEVLSAHLTRQQVATIVATPVTVLLIWALTDRTKWGRKQRAVFDDEYLAACSGIAINHVVLLGSMLGAAVGGLAAGLLALQDSTTPFTGFHLLVPALAAAIIGGLGRVPGPAVYGVVIGVAAELFGWWVSIAWQDVLALGVLVLYLVIRPMRSALSAELGVRL